MKKPITAILFALVAFHAPAAEDLAVMQKNDVILFQGDSITDGGRQRTGSDYNHIMGQDYGYIIAAEVGAEYPERNLTFLNRGNSGNRVTDLAGRWQKDALDLKPHVLSILIGINDSTGELAGRPEAFEQVYDQLITEARAALPGVKIVLCEPFVLPVGKIKANYPALLAVVRQHQAVVAKLAAKYDLPYVRFQDAFDKECLTTPPDHWSWDGIHPTYAGHGLMAKEWLRAVNAFWPPAPQPTGPASHRG